MQRTGFKPRQTGLVRTTGLARTSWLPTVSKRQAKQKREQTKAYAVADDAEQCWCSVCGKPGPTEHSHHYSQKRYPQHANDARNWLVMGKWCKCHRQFENNRAAFAADHPNLWQDILANMQAVDAKAFDEFMALHDFKISPSLSPLLSL